MSTWTMMTNTSFTSCVCISPRRTSAFLTGLRGKKESTATAGREAAPIRGNANVHNLRTPLRTNDDADINTQGLYGVSNFGNGSALLYTYVCIYIEPTLV